MEWRVGDELRVRRLSQVQGALRIPVNFQERVILHVGPVYVTVRPMWTVVGVDVRAEGHLPARVRRRRYRHGYDHPPLEKVLVSSLNLWWGEGYIYVEPGASIPEDEMSTS